MITKCSISLMHDTRLWDLSSAAVSILAGYPTVIRGEFNQPPEPGEK